MKILRDDMVRTADADPLDLFYQGIRSEETRGRYTRTLRQVLCEVFEDMLAGTFKERAAQLVRLARDDPGWTCDLLIILARKLRERTKLPQDDPDYLNPLSFGNYYSPIKKLFAMNDVAIQWRRIHATFPELDNIPDSMGWTRPEIARMLKHTRDARDRALVLVLASSGMRAGAPHQLNWGDLTPVYRNDDKLTLDPGEGSEVACAMLNVYRGSSEGYAAFITPEAFAALQEYARAWSGRMGRQAGPKDPMFIVMRYVPKRATQSAIQRRVEGVVAQAGLREAREGKRFRVPLMNGFRRFYNKTCKEALAGGSTLGSLIKHEFMMGHHGLTSLDENYFKTDALELAREYVKAVPDLTIDDTERLKRSNRVMAENIQNMEDEKDAKIERLEGQIRRMEEKVSEVGDQSGARADEILNAILRSPKSGGVPADVLESLTAMMSQLGAAQDDEIRKLRAEYDAKMDHVLRAMDRITKGGNYGHDPLDEFRDKGV